MSVAQRQYFKMILFVFDAAQGLNHLMTFLSSSGLSAVFFSVHPCYSQSGGRK